MCGCHWRTLALSLMSEENEMKLLNDLMGTDYGLMSLVVIAVVIVAMAMAAFVVVGKVMK